MNRKFFRRHRHIVIVTREEKETTCVDHTHHWERETEDDVREHECGARRLNANSWLFLLRQAKGNIIVVVVDLSSISIW